LSRFFKLVKNEFIKMFKTKSGFVPFALLAAMIIGIPVITNMLEGDSAKEAKVDWKTSLTSENAAIEKELAEQYQITKEQIESTEDLKEDPMDPTSMKIIKYKKNQYHLENDIGVDTGALGYLTKNLADAEMIIFLLIMVYASSIVAREYAFGTIKFLLIRSVSRFEILMSKLVTILLATALFYIFSAVLTYIVGGFLEGFVPETSRTVNIMDNKIVESSLVADVFRMIGFDIIELLPYIALAFLISIVMKSVGAAIGTTMFLNFAFGILVVAFLGKYDWSKYILFAHGDLKAVYAGSPMVDGITLGFSIVMLLLYTVVFLAISFATFIKRDV
jgi:ABC-2 type transport system permease protein